MARQDMERAERDSHPLQLPAIVTCPECSVDTDVVFIAPDGVFDMEDLTEAPQMTIKGYCGHNFLAEYEGWIAHEDAG